MIVLCAGADELSAQGIVVNGNIPKQRRPLTEDFKAKAAEDQYGDSDDSEVYDNMVNINLK